MRKFVVFGVLIAALVVSGAAWAVTGPVGAQSGAGFGGISYASRPDEAGLYLNNMVFVRDTVTLPNEPVRVLLPPGTYPDTLILTENDQRVRTYSVTPQGGDVYYSQAAFRYNAAPGYGGGTSYSLTWDAVESGADARTIKLEYMMSGAHWTPTYDMAIGEGEAVNLAFFAQIHNSGLMLDAARVYLIAGRVDLSEQVTQAAAMTMNQVAVGYAADPGGAPGLGVGSVDLQHIYMLDAVSAVPGDMVFVNLVDAELPARRLLAWYVQEDPQVNVIYKVRNTTEIPLAQGIVRAYRDGLFLGSDYVETTPLNSEGSITVGSLPDVRVNRRDSREYQGGATDYYQHTVELEINNFSENDLDMIVLDRWLDKAWQFEFSLEAERQQDNLLRWEVSIPAGESLTITYSFRTES